MLSCINYKNKSDEYNIITNELAMCEKFFIELEKNNK